METDFTRCFKRNIWVSRVPPLTFWLIIPPCSSHITPTDPHLLHHPPPLCRLLKAVFSLDHAAVSLPCLHSHSLSHTTQQPSQFVFMVTSRRLSGPRLGNFGPHKMWSEKVDQFPIYKCWMKIMCTNV